MSTKRKSKAAGTSAQPIVLADRAVEETPTIKVEEQKESSEPKEVVETPVTETTIVKEHTVSNTTVSTEYAEPDYTTLDSEVVYAEDTTEEEKVKKEIIDNVFTSTPTIVGATGKHVSCRVSKNHDCMIGKQRYHLVKGEIIALPVEVASILALSGHVIKR